MIKQQKTKKQELYDPFKDDGVMQYHEEAKQRWGNTDTYKQSMKRVQKMTKGEMEKTKEGAQLLTQKLACNMDKGIRDKEVQELIAEHYKGIRFFYDCPLEMYFEKAGKENTQRTLQIAREEALKRGISHIVVASTFGDIGLAAAEFE